MICTYEEKDEKEIEKILHNIELYHRGFLNDNGIMSLIVQMENQLLHLQRIIKKEELLDDY